MAPGDDVVNTLPFAVISRDDRTFSSAFVVSLVNAVAVDLLLLLEVGKWRMGIGTAVDLDKGDE